MSGFVQPVTDVTFATEVLQSEFPVLVDFWAEWCGPCRAIAPVLEEIAQDYAGKLRVLKCNVDENSQSPAQYGVLAIPTLILFKGGQQIGQHRGALSKAQLRAFIDSHL